MPKVRFSISIDSDLADRIRKQSETTGVPISVVAERLFFLWLKTGEIPPPIPKEGESV